MRYAVRHETQVRYTAQVKLARFNLRLRPVEWLGQKVTRHTLEVTPKARTMIAQDGPYVVNLARLTLDTPLSLLSVVSQFEVMVDRTLADLSTPAPSLADLRLQARQQRGIGARDPASYLFASPLAAAAPEIAAWAAPLLGDGDISVLAAASGLMQAIHRQFAYDSKATTATTTPIEAFRVRRGVCQDFAHVMIVALRHFGIPAAYVSGYLRTIPPPGRARLVGADATHAWVNVWCGSGLGWIGFDPTNALLVGNDHIFVAMGRDFTDVSPLDGVFIGGAGQKMSVSVEVAPLPG